MKDLRKTAFFLLTVMLLGIVLPGCASSRSCCNDLSRNYKPPKSHKRNVY